MADLTPRAFVLRSYTNSGLPWWKALAELIDNAINADCNQVVINMENRVLRVQDDGCGAKDVLSLFVLGDERHKRGNSMYGIGAKDAWLSCADDMRVCTVHRGIKSQMSVNIEKLIAANWQAPDPTVESTDEASGTVIELPIRKGKNLPGNDVFQKLAWAFTPAITSGKQILKVSGKKKESLRPFTMPHRDEVVAAEFDIDGKKVAIDIGILPDGQIVEQGPFWLIYKHRILESTSIGAGDYSVRRLAGTITLGDGWKISKNKDSLTENVERLRDAIFARIEHVLQKASSLSESLESEHLRSHIQGMLNEAVKEANKQGRGKRNSGSKRGTKKPTGKGGKHRLASVVHGDGDVKERDPSTPRLTSGIHFDWTTSDPASIGYFDASGSRVYLNDANPFVASLKSEDNRKAILCCVMSLIADDDCRHGENRQKLLKFEYKDFAEAIGRLLNERQEKEGADVNKAV